MAARTSMIRLNKVTVGLCLASLVMHMLLASQRWTVKCSCHRHNTDKEDSNESFLSGFGRPADERFVRYIRENWIDAPTAVKVNASVWGRERHFSQRGQSKFVDKALHKRRGGFFVECGAGNGVSISNSLFFERYRGWTGLLIEANPPLYKQLLQKHRNAFSANVCLSPSNKSSQLAFIPKGDVGGLFDTMKSSHFRSIQKKQQKKVVKTIKVQCFPFYSLLLAIGNPHIDYFSLDVEGAELDILKTIPFHLVSIDVLTIEFLVKSDAAETERRLRETRELFRKTGLYEEIGIIKGLDVVFKRLPKVDRK